MKIEHHKYDKTTVFITFDDEEDAKKFVEAWKKVHES